MKFLGDNRGFTLLEMTVSIGLFAAIVLILFSTLISLSQEAKLAQANRTVIGNLGATIESMARGIRMGKDFVCNPNPTSFPLYAGFMPTNNCVMLNADGEGGSSGVGTQSNYFAYVPIQPPPVFPVVFRLNEATQAIERSVQGGAPGTFTRFTAEEIKIDRLKFYVSQVGSGQQPMITILMGGYTDINRSADSRFDVQITVAARTPNL